MTRILIAMLRVYKRTLSRWLPPACRFSPSCSEYAALALGKHGLVRGGALSAWRLLRCQPFGAGGIDIP
jgi:putative membrane protein insertion efficiency factor